MGSWVYHMDRVQTGCLQLLGDFQPHPAMGIADGDTKAKGDSVLSLLPSTKSLPTQIQGDIGEWWWETWGIVKDGHHAPATSFNNGANHLGLPSASPKDDGLPLQLVHGLA